MVGFRSVLYTVGFGGTQPILFNICFEAKLKSLFRVSLLHIYIEEKKADKSSATINKIGLKKRFQEKGFDSVSDIAAGVEDQVLETLTYFTKIRIRF